MSETAEKKKMKKPIKIALIVLLCAVFVTGLVFAGLAVARAVEINSIEDLTVAGNYKNVILLIGDGMGFNHIAAARAYLGVERLFMESAAVVSGEATTYSRTIIGPTDSAAAATALATGQKTDNGMIAQYLGKDLKSNTEYAMEQGMATGVIASEGVKGATPAGFSAHVFNRNSTDEITRDQLAGGIDLFLGGAKDFYDDYAADIAANGYDYVTSASALSADSDKIWGAFADVSTSDGTDAAPTLAELSVFAMQYLAAKSENGFFLMIEESHIDKRSHSNDMAGMLEHLVAYDNTIKAVVQLAEEMGDTLVIATADHETGGLQYNGESGEELSDKMFTKGSHSTANVPFFVYGNIGEIPSIIDNTQIARICRTYILR